MIPRSTSWRILNFAEGMDIGPAPAGIEWFCGPTDPVNQEGIEWEALPPAGWGAMYGRSVGDQAFWIQPPVFLGQHIRMVPATVGTLTLLALTNVEYGTLTFVAATKTISRTTGTWTSLTPEGDYSIPGTKVTIAGSAFNNGVYTVVGLGATEQDLVVAEALVNEGPTAAPTVTGTRAFQVTQWTSTVLVRKPTVTGSIGIYGARPSDNLGGQGVASYDATSDTWTFSMLAPTAIGTTTITLGSDVIVGDLELTLVFSADENAVHFWAGGKYRGSSPVYDYTAALPYLSTMGVFVSGAFVPTPFTFASWRIGLGPGGGSIKPTGQTGPDKVVPLSRWCGFDAKKSSDPDGDPIGYKWRLIAAPSESTFVVTGSDGSSPGTAIFAAPSLTALTFSIVAGDILMVGGVPYEIVHVAPGNTSMTVAGLLPVLVNANFMIVRQGACVGAASRVFSFQPDVKGLFVASLRVWDPHGLFSDVDLAVCSAIQDLVPLGVPLDMGWMWNYLSDFWQIVEGKDWAPAAWMALARMASSLAQDLWNVDFDKSLATTQDVVCRRWLPYHPRLDELDPDAVTFESRLAPAVGVDRRYTDNDLDTLVVPGFPVTFTVTSYQEDGSHAINISVPAGTLYRDIPSVLNAALVATTDLNTISFTWRMTDPSFVNPVPPPPTLKLYSLSASSTQYNISVVEDSLAFYRHQTYSQLSGTSGVRLSSRVAWLDGLDIDGQIKVGDPINLGSRSFQVVGVTHRPGVAPTPTGYNPDGWVWLEVEVDRDIPIDAPIRFQWCSPSYWKSARTQWWSAGFTPGDLAFVERRPAGDDTAPATEVQLEVAAAGDTTLGTIANEMFWPAYQWRLTYGRRHFYVQTDYRSLEIPRLQEAPDKPTWVMEGWNHHMVDDRRDGRYVILNFRGEPTAEMDSGYLFRDRGPVTFLGDRLWAELTYWDNRPQVEANFGRMVRAYYEDFEAGVETNYLSIVTGLWHVYSNGPTPANIETACAIISGYPYAEARGTILSLVEDFMPGHSYALVRDDAQSAIVRSYVFETGDGIAINPATNVAYVAGDTIERFALFVDTQIYFDYLTDPDWWRSLVSGGLFEEPEKIHRFAVLLDVDFIDAALLTVVFNFLLDFKKSHTYPLFAGLLKRSTDIEIDDRVEITNILSLPTSLWSYPVPQHLDRPRLGSGIEIRPGGGSKPHAFFLVRPKDPAEKWVAIRLIEENGIGSPGPGAIMVSIVGVWKLIDVAYDFGVDKAANIVARINADPAASLLVEAYLPPGAVIDFKPWTFDGKIRVDPVPAALGSPLVLGFDIGVLGLVEVPGLVTLTATPGVDTLASMIATLNTSTQLTASEFNGPVSGTLELAVPPFPWVPPPPFPSPVLQWNLHCGEDEPRSDVGWSIVNYRGGYQLQIDGGGRAFPWLPGVLDEVSTLESFANPFTTLGEAIGANIVGAVIPGLNGKYRIMLPSPGPVWFHANPGGPPPWQPSPTMLVPKQDWLMFYDTTGPVPVIRSKGRILGSHTDQAFGEPAKIYGTTAAPFGVPAMALDLVDFFAGPVSIIVAAPVSDTADDWALAFSAALAGAGSAVSAKSLDGKLVFQTNAVGAGVSFGIVGGTACGLLGLTPGSFAVGVNDPFGMTANPNFYAAGGFNWVDVQMSDPEPNPPVAGDAFQVYRNMPDRSVMDFKNATDTDLGWNPDSNYTSVVADLGLVLDPITGLPDGTGRHRFQITLPPAMGRQFNSGVGTPTSLLPGQDWFWFFAGDWTVPEMWPTPVGYGMLESVDGQFQATLITAVGSPVPTIGTFVVLRNPGITYLWNLWTAACGDGTMHLLTLPKPGVDVANFPPKAGGIVY